jgi:hypothetical protein
MIDLDVASLNTTDYLYILMAGPLSVGVMELSTSSAARLVDVFEFGIPAQAAGLALSTCRCFMIRQKNKS